MAGRKFSTQEREEFLAKIDAKKQAQDEKLRLINLAYHRTPLYMATFVLRMLFLLFFTWIFFWDGGSGEITQETVLQTDKGIYLTYANVKVEKLTFETPAGDYEALFERTPMPYLSKGIQLNIEHNCVGKATYFFRKGEKIKYPLAVSWILYISIAILTVMSFKFNDALESFDHKFLWITWTANLFAFGHYFLT
ncbi:hypothetical protein CNR22_02245 [Sphingobacteriaceae bacterium]|nr:hypothetical protein CNR22_02245 [Sphingobacteriaceae bacterium]